MKENLDLSYHEIAKELNRDERTIWTAFKRASEKQTEKLEPKESDNFIDANIFKNREYTPLETLIIYLREEGMKYSEIGKLLDRDQRNIWTIYNRITRNKKQ